MLVEILVGRSERFAGQREKRGFEFSEILREKNIREMKFLSPIFLKYLSGKITKLPWSS